MARPSPRYRLKRGVHRPAEYPDNIAAANQGELDGVMRPVRGGKPMKARALS